MSVSYWQDNNTQSNLGLKFYDVVIIGGGISGLSTAYWIGQKDKNLKIAILEKGLIGSGATGRNAGFITCGSVEHFNRLVQTHGLDFALTSWKYSEDNLALLKEHIINKSEKELYFENLGSFSLASSSSELDELKKSYELMKENSINVSILDEKSVKTRLGAEGFVGGIKYHDDASIHPLKLLNQIKSKLPSNVDIFENHEVFSIEKDKNERLVKTNNAYFKSSLIVSALNAYSPLVNPYFEDKIFPTIGQILITEKVPRFMEGPCYANFVLDYFRQLPTGELIIGGFRQLEKDNQVGYSDETSKTIQLALEEFLKKHIPNVTNAKITHRWSGTMGFSADGNVMVGSLPTDNQFFFLGGFTAHGLGLAFNTAKYLSDLIFGEEIPEFISAKRFS